MSEPTYTQFTERMYARLPEVMREADSLNGYALKRYISAIGDVEDQVERLVARFTYLSAQERLGLDALNDDHSYYALDWSYFQSAGSYNSAAITSQGPAAFLRTVDSYRVVPNTTIYAGAVFRTDVASPDSTYGLRVWYYDASMVFMATRDLGRNNGSVGPQWVAINATDLVPDGAYYIRLAPFAQNATDAPATVWVDDVYVRSRYEVTTTNNLVSSGHNFTMRAERDLIRQGDFDAAQDIDDLTEWDLGPSVDLAERSLSGVPDIQSYRYWLTLDSDVAEQPGYARQVITGIEPNSTYTISALMVRDANVPDDSTVRVTVTPNTGGPVVRTFAMSGFERNVPALLSFAWNSPEAVSTAIVSIEYVTAAMPARGLLVNDVSVVRYGAGVSQMGRTGDPVTLATSERAGEALLESGDPRSDSWIRYATGGGPDEPLGPGDPDPVAGTSFIEAQWHQTRPGNTYAFTGEVFVDDVDSYADLIIWYRTEGKGWGEMMLHRISTTALSMWSRFTRIITIPDSATEFRVNLDVYRAGEDKTFRLRNLSLTPSTSRSWYTAGSRPFAFSALATRSLSFLTAGDLLHYTADVMVTGAPGAGRYGVRIIAGESQVIHETTVDTTARNEITRLTGAFQVPESLMELRAVFYVADPTPVHQAAYFLSDLQIVHSTQQIVEDPQNLIRNGGFESITPLEGWTLLAEREQVTRNLVVNARPTTNLVGWTTMAGSIIQLDGVPVAQSIANGTSTPYVFSDRAVSSFEAGETVTLRGTVEVIGSSTGPYGTLTARVRANIRSTNEYLPAGEVRIPIGERREVAIVLTLPKDVGAGDLTLSIITSGIAEAETKLRMWNVSITKGDTADVPFFDKDTPDTALATYTWDSATQAHVERRLDYVQPVGFPMSVGTGAGYNVEDVPDRPEGVPLGATSDLVDPRTANTEWLPWLSQFAGHNINHFSTLEDARQAFSDTESNFAAGTIGAIQNAVAAVLTGSKSVRVFPMTSDPAHRGEGTQWDVAIVTRTSESPDISVMAEAVAKRNAKPAGVVFHFHKHQSTWDAVELDNPTWDVWDRKTWIQIEESGLGS